MPSRGLRRDNLPSAPESGARGLGGAGAARPRARGVDSGRLPSQERPTVLGRGEADAAGDKGPSQGATGTRASASRLKAAVLVSEVLGFYGASVNFRAAWTSVRCPFHEDRNASASYNDAIGQFYCHGCEVHGDIFDIVQHAEGVEFPEAVEIIAKEFG